MIWRDKVTSLLTRAMSMRPLLTSASSVLPFFGSPGMVTNRAFTGRWHYFVLAAATAFAAVGSAAPAWAGQTTYTYDALGRLVRAEQTGAAGIAYDARYTFDAAGTRTTHVVSGATNSGPGDATNNAPRGMVVVPHVGSYRIIPLKRE